VFKYMGPDAPKVFTRTDKRICMQGLLPQISVHASESEVRDEICDVLRTCSSPDLSECIPSDFEFIDMSGKQARVPQCKAGFEWEGRAVKELAGPRCVYVRLPTINRAQVMSYCLSLLTVKTLLVQVVLHPTLLTVTTLPVLVVHHPQAIA